MLKANSRPLSGPSVGCPRVLGVCNTPLSPTAHKPHPQDLQLWPSTELMSSCNFSFSPSPPSQTPALDVQHQHTPAHCTDSISLVWEENSNLPYFASGITSTLDAVQGQRLSLSAELRIFIILKALLQSHLLFVCCSVARFQTVEEENRNYSTKWGCIHYWMAEFHYCRVFLNESNKDFLYTIVKSTI